MNSNFSALLIGCIAAFMPLYIRLSSVNLERVSKSNMLLCLIPVLLISFSRKLNDFSPNIKLLFCALIGHLVIFQFEPASFAGVYQAIAISMGMLFVVKYSEHSSDDDIPIVLNLICFGACIQSLLGIFQYFNIDLYEAFIRHAFRRVHVMGAYTSHHGEVYGSLLNPNVYGAYLALCLPAFFRKGFFVFIPLVGIPLIMSGSAMSIAAAACATVYFFAANSKLKESILYIGSTIGFYAVCMLFPLMTSDRLDIWKYYLNKISIKHSFLGMSSSWIEFNNMPIGTGFVNNVHNEFLSMFNIFGIGSILIAIYLIYLIISNENKNKIFASIFFAAFINMHGNFPLHIAATAFIILISTSYCLKGNYGSNVDR